MILGSYLSRLWPIFFLSIFMIQQRNKLFYLLLLVFVLSEALIFISGDRELFLYKFISNFRYFIFSKTQKIKNKNIINKYIFNCIHKFY